MNTATLDTMAFDNFEVADRKYLADMDGAGFVGAVAGGIVGFGTGVTAMYRPAKFVATIPEVGPEIAAGMEIVGGLAGMYTGAKAGWGDGGFW